MTMVRLDERYQKDVFAIEFVESKRMQEEEEGRLSGKECRVSVLTRQE